MNCIIIHGCPSDAEKAMNPKTRTYDKHWIPWTKKELIARGIKTETPLMPSPWEPDYVKFEKEFEKYEVNENTILIGHSCGCAFLVRWLGETKQKIGKLILVAPWKIPDKNDKFRKAFYTYPIDKTIKLRVKDIVMFTSDNEEEDGKKSLNLFHEVLDGKVIELKGRGHYTLEDMGTEEFPELLEQTIYARRVVMFVLRDKSGKIILQHRSKNQRLPDYWAFFGGGIEKNETPEQAVRREAKEELGIKLENLRFFKRYEFQEAPGLYEKLVYTATLEHSPGELKKQQKEGKDLGLVSFEDLKRLKISNNDLVVLRDIFEK